MNRRLFHKIYGIGVKTGAVKTAVVITKLSQKVFLLIYALGLLLAIYNSINRKASKYEAVLYVACTFAALAVNSILRKLINAPRPFKREGIKKYIDHEDSGSFPSNHAASAMVIALCCGVLPFNVCVGVAATCFFVLLALVTGISRIMVGVHYPADVVAGWFIGVLFGFIFFFLVGFPFV